MAADSKTTGAVLPAILRRQVAQLLGTQVVQAVAVTAGMTLARRWVVEFADGRRAFLKAAGNSATAQWLRREYNAYQSFKSPHLPKLIGWSDQPPGPFLLLEDLSKAHWPPPWTPQQISCALES